MRTALGLLLASVMLVGFGCASTPKTPPAPPSVNVTGAWAGNWSFQNPSLGGGSLRGTFQQDGSNLTGNFTIVGGGSAVRFPVTNLIGFVSGNQITLSQPSRGTLTVNGDQITGIVEGLDTANVTLRKQ